MRGLSCRTATFTLFGIFRITPENAQIGHLHAPKDCEMDKHFIIWTLRRTGGTTFATLLTEASSHPSVQHEPFNHERLYGHVMRDWSAGLDVGRMRASLAEILSKKVIIKHCYEVTPHPLNVALLSEAIKQDYHHVVLRRRAEVDRMFSLNIAQLTDAWGVETAKVVFDEIETGVRPKPVLPIAKSVAQMSECHLRTTWLVSAFKALGVPYTEIDFEDLYTDHEIGAAHVRTILAELGHSPEKIDLLTDKINLALTTRSQGTRRLDVFVANMAEWRDKMQQTFQLLQSAQTDRA